MQKADTRICAKTLEPIRSWNSEKQWNTFFDDVLPLISFISLSDNRFQIPNRHNGFTSLLSLAINNFFIYLNWWAFVLLGLLFQSKGQSNFLISARLICLFAGLFCLNNRHLLTERDYVSIPLQHSTIQWFLCQIRNIWTFFWLSSKTFTQPWTWTSPWARF